ncbi:uncharacterized protein LOC119989820 isoform X2 [Tripterygium wilfordii]|uniref:uncharacterized protein LOC119989820 isoform X2 n=1 Tax=Tripterygium wilfordii TaxID=458696 RepID=UPI0018F85BCC|nr:uncharacterized protein LOC119989820 isoform X2 [Tripterygium wilfordii]
MSVPQKTVMAFKSYQNQAEVLVKNYLFADPFIPYTSILGGLFACKVVYDLTQLISTFYIKTYSSLTKIQRIEWNNRGTSTVHAIFITAMSLYFVFWSDLFSDKQQSGLITFRSSPLSAFGLGVSVGYFFADLGMIFWLYPSLGGMESSITLFPEYLWHILCFLEKGSFTHIWSSSPRYLDTAGMKRSNAYLINGVLIFFLWLIARILLFVYLFNHVYRHYDQVMQLHIMGYFLVFVVPTALAILNLMWFGKILKGLKKTLAKKQ